MGQILEYLNGVFRRPQCHRCHTSYTAYTHIIKKPNEHLFGRLRTEAWACTLLLNCVTEIIQPEYRHNFASRCSISNWRSESLRFSIQQFSCLLASKRICLDRGRLVGLGDWTRGRAEIDGTLPKCPKVVNEQTPSPQLWCGAAFFLALYSTFLTPLSIPLSKFYSQFIAYNTKWSSHTVFLRVPDFPKITASLACTLHYMKFAAASDESGGLYSISHTSFQLIPGQFRSSPHTLFHRPNGHRIGWSDKKSWRETMQREQEQQGINQSDQIIR